MSDAIYPITPGLTWPIKKSPAFSTVINDADGGGEARIAKWASPKWHYELAYEFLRDGSAWSELQSLMGFFLARQGRYDSFLFYDQDDHTASAQTFGLGDGSSTSYQLCRACGGFVEPVRGIVTAPIITVNGTASSAFTWTTGGVVTFATAPAAGSVLAWSGSIYFRVRFDMDQVEFEKFMSGFWEVKSIKMVTAR